MRELWKELIVFGAKEFPGAVDIRAGAKPEELMDLETLIGRSLPEDFKNFYQVHDGEDSSSVGLMYGLLFMPIKEIGAEWKMWRGLEAQFAYGAQSSDQSGGRINHRYINSGWLPFTHDWGGNHIGLDLDPTSLGTYGQIINFGRDQENKYVIAKSFTEFIDWLNELYTAENFLIKEGEDGEALIFEVKDPAGPFLDVIAKLDRPGK